MRISDWSSDVCSSDLLVLQEIDRRGEATPSIIASSLQFGQATVTNILDRLEGLAFVTRQRGERDKRQIFVRATAAGQDILKTAPDLLQVQFRDRFVALPTWEQAMILAALERLSEVLNAESIDAAPLLAAGAIDRRHPENGRAPGGERVG